MVSTVVLTGIFIVQDIRVIMDFTFIVEAFALTVLLGCEIGTLNAYLTFAFPVWKTVWGILTRPLFLISGVFFIYEDLPVNVQNLLWYNPLIHMTGLMRQGFYSTYDPNYVSVVFVALVGVIPMVFGVMLLYRFCKDAIYK